MIFSMLSAVRLNISHSVYNSIKYPGVTVVSVARGALQSDEKYDAKQLTCFEVINTDNQRLLISVH